MIYQTDPTTFYAWSPQTGGYHEITAAQVHAAKFFDLFGSMYDSIKDSVPYAMEWSNGTGGQSNAVIGEHAPTVAPGKIIKSASAARRMIIIGTYYGNVVVYDRFNYERTSVLKNYVVYDAPEELSTILDLCDPSGTLTEELYQDFFGSDRENIGQWLKNIYESIRATGRWRG